MSLNIGRKGWLGIFPETSYNVPGNPLDYIPFTSNTITGQTKYNPVVNANAIRDKNFSSITGEQWSKGDVETYLDSTIAGYFFYGALGSTATAALGGGVQQHTITRNNSNTPQSFTLINNRVIDQFEVSGAVVDQLQVKVSKDFATAKTSWLGQFPVTTTSGTPGTPVTTSGNVFSFKNAFLGFGTTVANADAAANLKPSDLTVTIKNNAEAVFRHGSAFPASINVKAFEADADFTVFFENTTDRDNYYNGVKQAAEIAFTGNGIGNGLNESIKIRFYQIHFDTFTLETGLENFYAEKGKMMGEYDNVNGKTVDAVIVNRTTNY